MRKWRPGHKCIFVISEIHGNIASLEVILNRILPLRKFEGQEDIVVFLGDYIDGDEYGPEVLDTLINVKKEYGDRAIILKGNHEDIMVRATFGVDSDFSNWIAMGGLSTISGYVRRSEASVPATAVSRNRLTQLIPAEHIALIRSMESYHMLDNYMFFHGSFDPKKTIADNDVNNFIYDQSGSKYVKECLGKKEVPVFLDNYVYVGAHNYNGTKPFIFQKYFMLGGSKQKIFVLELNSMSAVAATKGKTRIYKYELDYIE
jgi:calcineurin-like phosphoesterase family protein